MSFTNLPVLLILLLLYLKFFFFFDVFAVVSKVDLPISHHITAFYVIVIEEWIRKCVGIITSHNS